MTEARYYEVLRGGSIAYFPRPPKRDSWLVRWLPWPTIPLIYARKLVSKAGTR